MVLKQRTWIYEFKSLMLIGFNAMVVNVLYVSTGFLVYGFVIFEAVLYGYVYWLAIFLSSVCIVVVLICLPLFDVFVYLLWIFIPVSVICCFFPCFIILLIVLFLTQFCLCLSLLFYPYIFLHHLSVFGSYIWNLRNFPHDTWFLFLFLFALFSI